MQLFTFYYYMYPKNGKQQNILNFYFSQMDLIWFFPDLFHLTTVFYTSHTWVIWTVYSCL